MAERSKELQVLQQVSLIECRVDAEVMGNNWASFSLNGIEYSNSCNCISLTGDSQVMEEDKVASHQRPSSSPLTPRILSNSSISPKLNSSLPKFSIATIASESKMTGSDNKLLFGD
ncbi:hypothetical protein V8G54_005985 [Vigna mungo]|uniref:Uncharacterized protein n=1 Tax=Vigna mungo TaxID=3915 RepID=A0AAQ3S6W5_VIGMU